MKSVRSLLIIGLILLSTGSAIYALDCNVSFTTVVKMGPSGYCQANDFVIDNQADFCNFWNQVHMLMWPAPPCPGIDFSTYVVIVTAMGRKPNACYSTQITCIEEDQQGNYTVHVTDLFPKPGMFCPQMIVCPVHAVEAPIPDGTVTFQHHGQGGGGGLPIR
jgi:hypothetical protein